MQPGCKSHTWVWCPASMCICAYIYTSMCSYVHLTTYMHVCICIIIICYITCIRGYSFITYIDHSTSLMLVEDNTSYISDIWDAAMLKADVDFSKNNTIALSLCTDGVPLYKSSKTSLWPVYLAILNLHPSIRMKSKNIITAGLWIGPAKPPMNHLIKATTKHLDHLSYSWL